MKKKLLLHICCAPCSVYIFNKLSQEYEVCGLFYNPNIQPQTEFEFRKKELEKIAQNHGWNITYGAYDIEEWFVFIKGYEKEPERGKRCSLCFHIRLKKTFEYAKLGGFDVVSSTLSISPYKSTQQINKEGFQLSKQFNIEFLPEDFKKKDGYLISKKLAQDQGIQHQDYCGCVFSHQEKIFKIQSKK